MQNDCRDGTAAMLKESASRLPFRALPSRARASISRATRRSTPRAASASSSRTTTPFRMPVALRVRSAFAAHPDIDIFGGPIQPRFLAPPPSWLRDSLPRSPPHTDD